MQVLVDGAKGLLGQELVGVLSDVHEVIPIDVDELDITDFTAAQKLVGEIRPDALIHSAGFRFVDKAEENPHLAMSINALGAKNMALAAEQVGAKLVQISTGAVFDGKLGRPYTEFELPNPQNVYGLSKLAGEDAVRQHCSRAFVVRVSLLFGALGDSTTNMVGHIKERLDAGETDIPYPTDLCFTPTYTKDLAKTIAQMIETEAYGTYHITNSGIASRYDMSVYVAEALGYSAELIKPVEVKGGHTEDNAILEGLAFKTTFGIELRSWQEAMDDCLSEMGFV